MLHSRVNFPVLSLLLHACVNIPLSFEPDSATRASKPEWRPGVEYKYSEYSGSISLSLCVVRCTVLHCCLNNVCIYKHILYGFYLFGKSISDYHCAAKFNSQEKK